MNALEVWRPRRRHRGGRAKRVQQDLEAEEPAPQFQWRPRRRHRGGRAKRGEKDLEDKENVSPVALAPTPAQATRKASGGACGPLEPRVEARNTGLRDTFDDRDRRTQPWCVEVRKTFFHCTLLKTPPGTPNGQRRLCKTSPPRTEPRDFRPWQPLDEPEPQAASQEEEPPIMTPWRLHAHHVFTTPSSVGSPGLREDKFRPLAPSSSLPWAPVLPPFSSDSSFCAYSGPFPSPFWTRGSRPVPTGSSGPIPPPRLLLSDFLPSPEPKPIRMSESPELKPIRLSELLTPPQRRGGKGGWSQVDVALGLPRSPDDADLECVPRRLSFGA